jgi:hypothetical protein
VIRDGPTKGNARDRSLAFFKKFMSKEQQK